MGREAQTSKKRDSRRRKKRQGSSRGGDSAGEARSESVEAEPTASAWDEENRPRRVFVCIGSSCSDQKSRGILTELKKQIERQELEDRVHVYTATCLSHCLRAPVMQVYPEGTFYCNILPRDVRTIVSEHLERGQAVEHFTYDPFATIRWNDEIDS